MNMLKLSICALAVVLLQGCAQTMITFVTADLDTLLEASASTGDFKAKQETDVKAEVGDITAELPEESTTAE